MKAVDQVECICASDAGSGFISHLLASRMSTAIGLFTAEGSTTLANPALRSLFGDADEIWLGLILERLVEFDGSPADVSQDLAQHGRWHGALNQDAEDLPQTSPALGAVLTEIQGMSASVIGYICEIYPAWSGLTATPSTGHIELLTTRENEVLRHLVAGGSNKAMGRTLNVSSRTIEFHRANIMRKLGARSVTELLRVIHGR